jgi:phage/plasmid-associated DNA primase
MEASLRLTNNSLPLYNTDDSFCRKLVIIPFNSCFVDDPQLSNDNPFKRFVEGKIERINDPRYERNMSERELYDCYVNWCKTDEDIVGAPVPLEVFEETIGKILGIQKDNIYRYYRLLSDKT